VDLSYSNNVHLHQEPTYMLVSCSSVIVGELREIRHPETPWVRNCIKLIWVRLLVNPDAPLWGEAKLPEGPGYLLPNPTGHLPIWPSVNCVRGWSPRE
jgi:hypothetical protein